VVRVLSGGEGGEEDVEREGREREEGVCRGGRKKEM
jgi:hypothetical protein